MIARGLSIRVGHSVLKCEVHGREVRIVCEGANGDARALELARERLKQLAQRVHPGKVIR